MKKIFFVIMGMVMAIFGATWAFDMFSHDPFYAHRIVHTMMSREEIISWENARGIIDIFGWWLLLFGGILLMHRER